MPTASSVEKSPAENGLPASQAANGHEEQRQQPARVREVEQDRDQDFRGGVALGVQQAALLEEGSSTRSTRMGSTMNALLATNAVSSASRETPTTSR